MLLGVNVDHVATLRQARGTDYPDPLAAARVAEEAGADSITIHLREDRRHIQDADVERMQRSLRTRLNLEMAVTDEMTGIAGRIGPADCCLVPEKRAELTTEGGLDVREGLARIRAAVEELHASGIRVSLFIDPDADQIDAAAETGATVVELHTGGYAEETTASARDLELGRIRRAARHAADCGLTVHAGHGLHYENVGAIAAIPEIVELNIGHAIVARAVFAGMHAAVSEMKRQMLQARAA